MRAHWSYSCPGLPEQSVPDGMGTSTASSENLNTMSKNIFFDCWGTLAYFDNLKKETESLENELGGARFTDFYQLFLSWHKNTWPQEEFLHKVDQRIKFSKSEQKQIIDWVNYPQAALFPETKEVLQSLSSTNILVLLTNSPPTVDKQLEKLGISGFFEELVFSYQVGAMKPSEEIFRIALKKVNADPGETIMVGDTYTKDIVGAVQVGITGILVDRENTQEYKNKISSLKELNFFLH